MPDEMDQIRHATKGSALTYDSWRLHTLEEKTSRSVAEQLVRHEEAVKLAALKVKEGALQEAAELLEQLQQHVKGTIEALRKR